MNGIRRKAANAGLRPKGMYAQGRDVRADFGFLPNRDAFRDKAGNGKALARLNACLPSISPAARRCTGRMSAAVEALALIGVPAAVLGAEGRAMAANSLMRGMTSYIEWGADNRIEFTDKSAMLSLQQAMDALDAPASSMNGSFTVRGRKPGDSAVASLVPITGRSRRFLEGGLGILVVTPVTGPSFPDFAVIRSLFDLTPAEARVAQGLVEGRTISEMAERYGTGRETIRSQVKAVLNKTGSRRQAEAAMKLSGLHVLRIRQ